MNKENEQGQSQFLKVPQVAKVLSVSEITIYRLLKKGEFEGAFKVGQGQAWRIPRQSVLDLVEQWKEKRK